MARVAFYEGTINIGVNNLTARIYCRLLCKIHNKMHRIYLKPFHRVAFPRIYVDIKRMEKENTRKTDMLLTCA